MEDTIKVNGSKIKHKAKENNFIKTEAFMKEFGKMMKKKEKEYYTKMV